MSLERCKAQQPLLRVWVLFEVQREAVVGFEEVTVSEICFLKIAIMLDGEKTEKDKTRSGTINYEATIIMQKEVHVMQQPWEV